MRTECHSPPEGERYLRRIALFIGAITLAISAGSSTADETTRLSLLTSSAREIRFRAEFPAPLLEERHVQDRVLQSLTWPGLGVEGNPGDPGIPTLRVRVALPPTGEVDLESVPEPLGSMGSVTFPLTPALLEPKPARERPEPALAGGGTTEPKANYRTPPPATIEDIGWERGLRVATVVLHPVTWDAASGTAAWSRALDVTLRVESAPSPLRPHRPRPDRVGESSWKQSLINPEAVAAFRVSQADTVPPCAGVPAVWFGNADNWVKIEIDHNGIFGLTKSALAAAGVPVDAIDPQTFRLYSGPLYPDLPWTNSGWLTPPISCNVDTPQQSWKHVYQKPAFCSGFSDSSDFREIGLWVKGEGDHTFDSGDAVVFYALGPDNFRDRFGLPEVGEGYFTNPYSAHTVYWLTWDSSLPGTPLRIQDVDAAPVSGDAEITETEARVHAEQNTFEDPSLYQVGFRWERWFWERMTSDGGATRSIVSLPHLVAGSAMDAIIRFWGAKVPSISDPGEAALHHIQVTVNQVNAGLKVWGGRGAVSSFTALDDTVLAVPARSQSEFLFLVPRVASSDPNRLDWVHLAWIDVAYRRDLALDLTAPYVQSELEIEGQPNRRTLNLTGIPSGTPVLFDVTDVRHPRRLVNGAQSGTGQRVSWDRMQKGVLAAGMEGSLSAPARVSLDQRPVQWLRDTSEPLDYVIITQEGWMSEAEALAEWRREHLYGVTDTTSGNPARDARVRVVSVDDVMDEFAWGMWDPAALRYFLEYAYLFYGGPGSDPLSYCLFLGDATNDPRNYGESGSKDYVPSWEDNRDNINQIGYGNIQYVSDDPLARFDDPSPCPDSYTDLYIGRLPVSSRAEARALIQDKVIQSEASPVYGPWRTKAILVADDVCQGGGPDPLSTAHMLQMEEVSNSIPPLFQQDKIYLYEYGSDCSIITKPEAKTDLIKSWSEGAWLVDYVGHGGDVVWADEHVLDLNDTPLLTNAGKFPVVGSFSCSVGKFSNPVRDGLGEAHVRALHGGALVSIAATHLTSAAANSAINFYFVKKLFSTSTIEPLPIGVALMEVKRQIPAAQGDKYVCLGDAASRLSVPGESLALSGPSRLDRGALVSVAARTEGGGIRSGMMTVEARDAKFVHTTPLLYKMPGALLYHGQSAVSSDTASVDFTVPISLRGGPDGRIAAYASGANWDAAGVLSPLAVGGLASTGNDTLGPTIGFSVNGPEVDAGQTVTVTLEDPSGINLTRLFEFRSILLKVTDRNGLEQLRQDVTESFSYAVGSSTHGSLEFRVPNLSPGAYVFSISATDNYNNRSQSALSVEVGNASTALAFEGTHLAYPNPFDPAGEPTKLLFSLNRSAQVTIRVYSVSGRLVRVADFSAQAGPNAFAWDGRDEAGDPVANGVYLFRVAAQREGSDDARFLERIVVLR
jgi:peptidase C25-like protein/flagellar hook capping protein FlgD